MPSNSRRLLSMSPPAFVLLSIAGNLPAADFKPFDGPGPVVVLIQTNPWAMVVGADTPRVAAYADGTVIYLRTSGATEEYRTKVLSAPELANFEKRLTAAANLQRVQPHSTLRPNVTDQPEALIYLHVGDRELATSVYGLRVSDGKLVDRFAPSGKPAAPPRELLELQGFLVSLDFPDSQAWIPRYVEVMIWPYEYAPDASIVWPAKWPGLDSGRTVGRGDSYSIFLDGDAIPELEKFLATRREKGAVEIGGKKWAVSYRHVFPSEPVWRKVLSASPDRE